ncbi:MAG: helix-turn-helix transcriptional regulator, partial [Chloroflexi bacterium]|nr:helix-turn-helix transcriptional regulator [Chloroflexota bacterium]
MSPGEGSAKQPRRRGRPSKHMPAVQELQEQKQPPQQSDLADEQLTDTLEGEHLSPFNTFLRQILRHDRAEIARVAYELDVSENTIYRWMNGISVPRPVYLRKIIEVLPQHRVNLTYVINQTFPGLLDELSTGVQEVQKDIYRRVIELVATTAESEARHWQITQAIFDYALLQLDAERLGLAITYARLMPAHSDGIHSLCEAIMRGNYPWPFALENHAYLGSTTLAGTAAMLDRMQTWDNLEESIRLQVEVDDFERSACAYPVTRGGQIGGVLIISSTQPGFFSNALACEAVVEYAQLLALAFPEDDFQPFSMLNLRPMPDLKWQRAEIGRSYVNRIIACARKLRISRQEAELRVRADMEAEFEELGRIDYARRYSEE